MFHYPNKGKLGMVSPLLSFWMKSSHPCQTQLSSETHKNTEQICFSWSMCVPAKKQYPEVLQPSFISLRLYQPGGAPSPTCLRAQRLLPRTEHIQLQCSEEQIEYASLAGHTAASAATLLTFVQQ